MNFNDMVSGPIMWLQSRVASCPTSAMLYAILMSTKISADKRMPTGYTDGVNIGINPEFIASMDAKSRVVLLAHESMHIMLRHVQNAKRDCLTHQQMRTANVLMDVYINEWIRSQYGFTMQLDGKQFGMYLDTPKLWKDDIVPPFDPLKHDWTFLIPYLNKQGGGEGGGGVGDGSDVIMDGDEATDAAADRLIERASNVLRELNNKHRWGNVPGWMERLLQENTGSAKVPWQDELFDALKTSIPTEESYRRLKSPYKFFRAAVPTISVPSVGPIVVATDTSGSMGVEQLTAVLSELRGIWAMMKPEKIFSVFCDCEINNVEEIEPNAEFKFTPKGGGGTDFRPPFKWVEDNDVQPSYMIYFTDGYGDFPSEAPDYPVIWVRVGEHASKDFPFGRVITVEV